MSAAEMDLLVEFVTFSVYPIIYLTSVRDWESNITNTKVPQITLIRG